MVDIPYNPNVSADIMFVSFALAFVGDEPLALTSKIFKSPSGPLLEGYWIL
jgi:hypothetical protein